MCEQTHVLDRISLQGQRRREELQSWVAADLASGDASLGSALRKWRDSVVPRLRPATLRPQMFRIPDIFVENLGLKWQRVLLTEGDAVVEVWEYDRPQGILVTGNIIVPKK